MRKGYLGYALVGLVLYLILGSSQIRWIALGFGLIMLLFGLFSKTREANGDEGDIREAHPHQVSEEVTMDPELELDEENPTKGENPIEAGGKF